MSFKIEQGLFNLDFIDHHAILGVPVDADPKDIRKRYLKLARRLHPDSRAADSEADRALANEFLSKLVNPSYEKLSQEKNYTEYCVLLKLKGQQALRQQDTVMLTSEAARALAATRDIDHVYRSSIQDLSDKLYEGLDDTLNLVGQISELNLVYLMRKEAKGETTTLQPNQKTVAATGNVSRAGGPAPMSKPAAAPPRESILSAYLRRAQEFEAKQDFPKAILELREAIQIDPKNSNCHSRLGVVYLKTNQLTMAKIHFNQALKLNPQDAVALEGMKKLGQPTGQNTGAQQVNTKSNNKDGKSGGGLFGWFGGKKR